MKKKKISSLLAAIVLCAALLFSDAGGVLVTAWAADENDIPVDVVVVGAEGEENQGENQEDGNQEGDNLLGGEENDFFQTQSIPSLGSVGPLGSTVSSGTCGSNLTWTLDEEGTLTISGTGAMANYKVDGGSGKEAPWYNFDYTGNTVIERVIISNGVTSIGDYAFHTCSYLSEISIPNSVTKIGVGAFMGLTLLTEVSLPANLQEIGASAFSATELTSITIPEKVTKINDNTFSQCNSLVSVSLPSHLTEIGVDAFNWCSSLEDINIPSSVTTIKERAFGATNIRSFTIPSGITAISNRLFESCEELRSVTIPDTVREVGEYAFAGCENLAEINLPFSNITSIGKGAFSYTAITDIIPTPNISSIGARVYECCDGLTNVTIPSYITTIGNDAFSYCTNLESITFHAGVTDIGSGAFEGCSKLNNVVIPNGITTIKENTFKLCSGLTTITLPASIRSIGIYAFRLCESLSDVHYDGIRSNWELVTVAEDNACLTDATIHCTDDGLQYTVQFNSLGGSTVAPQTVDKDSKITKPADPSRDGCTFRGWYTDTTFVTAWDFNNNKVTRNMTLYAYWEDNGSGGGGPVSDLESLTLDYGSNTQVVQWGPSLFNKSATPGYYGDTNPYAMDMNLAYTALWLCGKANNKTSSDIRGAYTKLGFTDIVARFYDDDYVGWDPSKPGYCFAAKEANIGGSNKLLVSFVGRGTQDIAETIVKDGIGVVDGFLYPGSIAYQDLVDHLQNYYPEYSELNTILFITGHSMGGGVAGQVARMAAADGFSTSRTFVYTFAATNYNLMHSSPIYYPNVFTIMNEKDVVPSLCLGEHLGTRVEYSRDFEDGGFPPNHQVENYYHCLSENTPSYYIGNSNKTIKCDIIACPVDISVYDSKNRLIARTIGETVENNSSGDIYVVVDGDTKYVYAVDSSKYTISFKGTGDGTMQYTKQILDTSTWKAQKQTAFKDVGLYNGKQMKNVSDVATGNLGTELYLLDSSGKAVKTIQRDGTEMEISSGTSSNTPSTPSSPSNSSTTFAAGQKITLSNILPSGSAAYAKYTVSPKGYASISKGVVTAKKAGTVTITGYVKTGKKTYNAEKTVTIKIEKPQFSQKTVTKTKPNDTISGKYYLTGCTIAPTSWGSSKPAVATVSSDGTIKTVGKGSTKITAYFGSGKQAAKYSFTVKVVIPYLSKKTANMVTGAAMQIKVKNAKGYTATWRSSDNSIAMVNGGKVTAVSAGNVKITATVDGADYSCDVTVKPPEIRKATLSVKVGKSTKVSLKNTKLKNISWSSSDTSVATVDSAGKVYAKKAGTTRITTSTGGKTNTCTVTVK